MVMYFNYDAEGVPVSFVYNGTTYYYTTNLQGDIVGIACPCRRYLRIRRKRRGKILFYRRTANGRPYIRRMKIFP